MIRFVTVRTSYVTSVTAENRTLDEAVRTVISECEVGSESLTKSIAAALVDNLGRYSEAFAPDHAPAAE